jgi:hypothetical protein
MALCGHTSAAGGIFLCREYTKKNAERLDIMIKRIQADKVIDV